MFLYNDAIKAIPFLQNREELFYNKYLELLTPQKYLQGAMLIKAKTHSEEMFMILSGEVYNTNSHRIFSAGSIIGVTGIIYKRDRSETYLANTTTVYVLMYDILTLHNMMREFPDIKEELEYLAE
jgi:signal-transduction protein with cAMP-binding, CBS, and nucleotidyltransferase domain